MGFFSKIFGGKKGSVTNELVDVDPLKSAVAGPLSSFLASRIGKSVGNYPGEFPSLDKDAMARYKELVQFSPQDFFENEVAKPATDLYKRELLPIVREGYAGSLRGSGRYRAEEAGINEFSEALARTRADFIPDMFTKQVDAGLKVWESENERSLRQELDWWRSLPENNPVVKDSLSFLGNGISTGQQMITTIDPGQKSWVWDALKIAAQVGTAIATKGA